MSLKVALLNPLERLTKIGFEIIILAVFITMISDDASPRYFVVITITATGQKATNDAKATVAWLASPTIAELRMRNFEVSGSKGWETKNGIFISNRNQPAILQLKGYCQKNQQLRFFRTAFSGIAGIEINGRQSTTDLYSDRAAVRSIELKDYIAKRKWDLSLNLENYCAKFMKCVLLLVLFFVLCEFINSNIPAPSPKARMYLLLGTFALFILFILCFYPGVFGADAEYQYHQAVHRDFDDWFPPIMAFIWSIIATIIKGTAGMFLLNSFMLFYSFYLLSKKALSSGKKLFFLPLMILWLPTISGIGFVIEKDISMAFSILLAFALWYSRPVPGELSRLRIFLILILSFYASCVRFNAPAATIPLIFLFATEFAPKWKAALITVALTALFFLGNYLFSYKVLHAKKTYASQSFLAHDLMGIYAISGKNYFPDTYLSKKNLDLLMKKFEQTNLDRTAWEGLATTDPQIIQTLQKRWLTAILEQKRAYLLHRWILFKSFLSDLDGWVYWYVPLIAPVRGVSTPPLLFRNSMLARGYKGGMLELYNGSAFLFRALTYLLLSLVILAISIRQRIVTAAVLGISSISYLALYFFVAPVASYRYIYWSVLATAVAITILWIENRTLLCGSEAERKLVVADRN